MAARTLRPVVTSPSTFGFILAYIFICVGAPVLLYREAGRMTALVVVAAVVGIAATIATYVANLTPVPPWPYDILPYVFLGLMIIGGIVYLWLKSSRPDAVRNIGTVEEEAEMELTAVEA